MNDIMDTIMARDPNGWERMPTDEDYELFESWIVRTYGQDALARYRGWGRSEDTPYEPWADDPKNNGEWA